MDLKLVNSINRGLNLPTVCFQETKASSTYVAWDKRVFEKLDVIAGQFSVSVLLRRVADDFVWACIGVYGPNDDGQ